MVGNRNTEGGLRDHRIEFARESTLGVPPTDPSMLKYSTSMSEFNWTSESTNEPRFGLGEATPVGFTKGFESHEITVTYDLVKWFDDSSGNANDAAYDGMSRDSDNLLPNSHTIIDREDKGLIQANQTVSGNSQYATRLYTVGKGGLIDEVAITGDPSDTQAVQVELTYLVQKARTYQIDQPASSTDLVVVSSDSGDTTQSVTIENEGASTTETLALNGTSIVQSTSTFGDIDSISIDAETVGDVTVAINSGTDTSPAQGDALCVIKGSNSYEGIEGDLGVPPLGAGSHESLTGTAAEFVGDTISQAGTPFPYEIAAATATIANNLEETERASGFELALHPGNMEITMEATMYGESMTHDMLEDHLQNTQKNVTWNMDDGTLQFNNAMLNEPGERAIEEGQAVMTTDNTFMAEGLTIN